MTFKQALDLGVDIMDHSAIALAQDNKLPVFVMKTEEMENLCAEECRGTYLNG